MQDLFLSGKPIKPSKKQKQKVRKKPTEVILTPALAYVSVGAVLTAPPPKNSAKGAAAPINEFGLLLFFIPFPPGILRAGNAR